MGQYHQFEVNTDAVLAGVNYLETMGARSAGIVTEMKAIAKIALIETFEYAMYEANSDGGYPYEFQQHTMDVVRGFQDIDASWYGGGIVVGVDFDSLGTEEELQLAFHQGAKLAGGGEVWGPYYGESLRTEDSETSHRFWEAVRYNHPTYQNPKTGKDVKMDKLVNHPWEEVVNKYTEIWGSKAPEWLFMQYGQEQYEPTIPQIDIIGMFGDNLYRLAGELLAAFVDAEVRIASSYRTTGADVGFTKTGQPRLESPLLTVGGKVYRKGQFVPKNL